MTTPTSMMTVEPTTTTNREGQTTAMTSETGATITLGAGISSSSGTTSLLACYENAVKTDLSEFTITHVHQSSSNHSVSTSYETVHQIQIQT